MKHLKIEASSDAIRLALAVEEPAGEPVGVVQLIHGMCEHKERYFPLMDFLASNGYVCVINDLRGHGESLRSREDLGYMYEGGWRAMVEDERLVCDWAKNEYPGLPYILFGHSMGSMVARSFAKRYDDRLDELFVCGSPSNNPAASAGRLLAGAISLLRGGYFRSKLLQRMSFGTYNKPFEGEGHSSAWVCSDEKVLDDYRNDPLCHFSFTVNGFYNLMGLMMDCYSPKGWKVSDGGMPIHFISGAKDPCRISDKAFSDSVELMKKIGYRNVDSRLYAGMRHEIHQEKEKMTVWNDILSALVRK